ncbi:MAG: glycosyltransferase family A protein [Candidatus Nanoarchaeia archaeon]
MIGKEFDNGVLTTIKYWKNQSYKNKELIFVIPEDNLKINGVKIIKDPKKGPSYARNIGVKNSTGQIIIFSDSDKNRTFINEKDFIKQIMEIFNKKDVDYVFADYLPYLNKNIFRNSINIKDFGSRSSAVKHLPEAYSKKILGNTPFNDKLEYGEDKFLFEKVKKRSKKYGSIKMPILKDSCLIDISSFISRYKWYGKTIKKYMKEKKDYKPIINILFGFVFIASFFVNLWIIPISFVLFVYYKQRKILKYCIKKKAFISFLVSPFISIISYLIIAIFFIQSLFI